MRDGMAAALRDPGHEFSRGEVAELMAMAYRWGYEHRVDEENGLIDEEVTLIFNGGETITVAERLIHRRASDLRARRPWPKDFPGRPG